MGMISYTPLFMKHLMQGCRSGYHAHWLPHEFTTYWIRQPSNTAHVKVGLQCLGPKGMHRSEVPHRGTCRLLPVESPVMTALPFKQDYAQCNLIQAVESAILHVLQLT